jgi:hypothetical protein
MELQNVLSAAHDIMEHETDSLLRSVHSIRSSLHPISESVSSSLHHPLNPMGNHNNNNNQSNHSNSNNNNNHNNSSIFSNAQSGHVSNLDSFFKSMYQYYSSKGLPATLLAQLCSIFSLGFTISFTIFLLAFVDWEGVLACHDEASCDGLSHYFVKNPFRHDSLMYSFLVLLYFGIFGSFW